MRWIKEFFLVFGVILFQSQYRLCDAFDLLGLFSFYFVLRFNWLEGSIFALLGGLIWDSLSGAPLGSKTLALVGACVLVGLFHSVIYQQHMIARMMMVFVGIFLGLNLEWLFYCLQGVMRPSLFSHSLGVALKTAILSIFIYPVLNRIFRTRYEQWMAS